LILWQVGVIGRLDHSENHDNKKGMAVLLNHLFRYYNANHEVILYSAAIYPTFEPQITKLPLEELATIAVSRTTTLYIPPLRQSFTNKEMLEALEIDIDK
jgi:2-hydroxy-3-keto-5-methylthiopentenyl-1-phosphate phosphatase